MSEMKIILELKMRSRFTRRNSGIMKRCGCNGGPLWCDDMETSKTPARRSNAETGSKNL
jgi:hypothetical protein